MKKRVSLFAMLLFAILLSCEVASAAEPILENVNLSPAEPTKLSTIQFTVRLTGEDIEAVNIGVLECNTTTGLCEKNPDNTTMIIGEGETYSANITLNYKTASYLTYWVYVKSQGTWTTLPDTHGVKINLTVPSSNGTTNGNGNGDDNKTPGFELLFFIVAMSGSIILLRRKRFR